VDLSIRLNRSRHTDILANRIPEQCRGDTYSKNASRTGPI
jgi:hypothetical protein